ncbi:MAG TPA: NAD(P)-binding domain-containing protein [Candidatus Binataceae bacterium]|nr:NAD(P)-binding domain-containing protein [Candidatus Binataceae bacterium]
MNVRIAPLALGLVVAAIAVALLAPRSSYEPGDLLAAHEQLSGDCASCHRAWRGPSSDSCVSCHGDFADNNPHAGFDVTQQDMGLMPGRHLAVSSSENLECLSCHTEHRGALVDVHVTAAFACTWCHNHPAIDKVEKHMVRVMQRQFFVRHLFKQPFNHHEHELLITSHYPPIAGGFSCTSCHLVPPVAPGQHEQMSFKWSGCAGVGCHVAPQDSFMRMPASIGPSPVTIAYSGVFPMRHINAVFVHSAGHLRSACQDCHFEVAASTGPDDAASLAIKRCFACHAHEAPSSAHAPPQSAAKLTGVAFAASQPVQADHAVVACGQCHLMHTYGVVPTLDFPNPAPKFPPGQRRHLVFTLYVPHWEHTAAHGNPVHLRRVAFSPWWLGLIAIGFVSYRFARFVRKLPTTQISQEAVAGVAPQRSKEVPALDDTYQTSVPHLYIVGEAAGTASINLAMRSGRQVIEAIVNELKHKAPPPRPDLYDVVIVGCGPAGLGATATARVSGLHYATLEKLTPASTLRSYPRAKFVQATPIDIAEYGSFFLEGDNSREELIKEWEKIIAKLGLVINDREEVVDVTSEQDYQIVKTARGNAYPTRCVVLAIGVRGNPRRLNLPGEVAGRVFYNLIEPDEFTNRKILVAGGGNAGAEVVQALAVAKLGNVVSYSFRSPVLTNVTRENADAIIALQQAKVITVYPSTALSEIRPNSAVLEPVKSSGAQQGPAGRMSGPIEIENDAIFAMIGAELPTGFLKAIGVRMVSKGRAYG